ncbi:MAG: SH3 domain-containing protein [Acidobacteriia bacterium]|nr:SH3 domain-containing protein [Terriglobia bacterium]
MPGGLAVAAFLQILLLTGTAPLHGHEHRTKPDYGTSFSTEISSPESMVLQAVEEVVNDGIIQGSKEYNKDKYIEKASSATSSPLFPTWKEAGKVYYKVRTHVLAPANFKESQDEGTLAVRYIVQSKDASRTILRIDAVFVEDFRRAAHSSDGSVENAEYRDIQDHVDALELQKKQAEESARHRQEELGKQALERKRVQEEATVVSAAQTSPTTLEQHVQNLRRQVERIVKAPGATLKSAPFQSASSLKTLDAGTELVILITTPYWYGVETHDGQHSWVNHSQVELLP